MGRLIIIWVLILITSMPPHVLLAQDNDLIFQRFSIQQGLSHNSILCMIQDRRGFLWFGTYDGLNRFDGYQFKEYNHDYQDTTSISQNLRTAKVGFGWVLQVRAYAVWIPKLINLPGIQSHLKKTGKKRKYLPSVHYKKI